MELVKNLTNHCIYHLSTEIRTSNNIYGYFNKLFKSNLWIDDNLYKTKCSENVIIINSAMKICFIQPEQS